MSNLATRLEAAIRARGVSVAELMARSRRSKNAIYRILDGTTPASSVRAATITALADALMVSRDWLLDGRGAMEPGRRVVEMGTAAQLQEAAGSWEERFPGALSSALDSAGMTSSELAAVLGVSLSTITRWLSGERTPRATLLPRLSRILSFDFTVSGQAPQVAGATPFEQAVLDEMRRLTPKQRRLLLSLARLMHANPARAPEKRSALANRSNRSR